MPPQSPVEGTLSIQCKSHCCLLEATCKPRQLRLQEASKSWSDILILAYGTDSRCSERFKADVESGQQVYVIYAA